MNADAVAAEQFLPPGGESASSTAGDDQDAAVLLEEAETLPQYRHGAVSVLCPGRRRLFKILQNHVGLLWIAYPVIWLASPVGLSVVGAVGTSMIIAYLDAVAKTPYVYFIWRERFGFADRSEDAAKLPDSGPDHPDPAGSASDD